MKELILFFMLCLINMNTAMSQLTDIDGNTYKTVKIGDQTWLAEDLKVTHFRNGDEIPLAKTQDELEQLGKLKKPARIIVTDAKKNVFVKYNWYAVNDARGLAPEFWHVPLYKEWQILINTVGDIVELKSATGWLANDNGRNKFNFNAKPNEGDQSCAFWWTASEIEMTEKNAPKIYAHNIELSGNPDMDCFVSNPFKEYAFSVRCTMNE